MSATKQNALECWRGFLEILSLQVCYQSHLECHRCRNNLQVLEIFWSTLASDLASVQRNHPALCMKSLFLFVGSLEAQSSHCIEESYVSTHKVESIIRASLVGGCQSLAIIFNMIHLQNKTQPSQLASLSWEIDKMKYYPYCHRCPLVTCELQVELASFSRSDPGAKWFLFLR